MTDTVLERSTTTPRDIVEGHVCTLGRFITEKEGWHVVEVAATWEGTPYATVGAQSTKGVKGDCSGTTHKIYVEAGFPYPYKQTATFVSFVDASHRFREIHPEREPMQAGDVLLWSGHMAIYAPLPEGHPKRNTGVVRRGRNMNNDFYTAFNQRTGTPYGPYNIATFRGDAYRVFRYYLMPGDAGCTN